MNFFNVIFNGLKDWCSSLGLNTIFLIFLVALLVAIAVTIVVIAFSIENKTARAIVKIEEYLVNNPFITNENIVEFNRLMKKIPRTLRTKWQQYVVNRDKKPSDFFNEEDCIEKPFKTRGFTQALVIFKSILISLVSLSFIFSACAISSNSIVLAIQQCSLTPLIIAIVGVIFIIIVNAVHNKVRSNMYFKFKDMTKLLDRAVTTFPDIVDYEILFTKKEIDAMIPELQEYLRQRAVYEQQQLEKAKENEVEHENYDFSALGVDGSLVMERAIKECEYYLGNRRKSLSAIEQLQSEKDLLSKSYDEKNKISQRKLRDINETLDRLREKLNNTTNKIVGNDIRRQQAEEIKKQQNIEREIEEDNNRYVLEVKKVDDQINSKKQDIDNSRQYIEVAFTNEFKAYADKVYEKLYSLTAEKVKDEVNNLTTENQTLKTQMEEKDLFIIEKNKLFDEKMDLLSKSEEQVNSLQTELKNYEEYKNQVEEYLNQKESEANENAQRLMSLSSQNEQLRIELNEQEARYKELKKTKVVEVARCFDVNGNEFFYDEEGLPYYLNENNNKVYYYSKQDKVDGNVNSDAPKTKQEMEQVLASSSKDAEENAEQISSENQNVTEDVVDTDNINIVDFTGSENNETSTETEKTDDNKNWQDLLDDFDDEESEDDTPIVNDEVKQNDDWSYEKFWADDEDTKAETLEQETQNQKPSEVEDKDVVGEETPVVTEKEKFEPIIETKPQNNEEVIEDDGILDEFADLKEDNKVDKKEDSKKEETKKTDSKKPTAKKGAKAKSSEQAKKSAKSKPKTAKKNVEKSSKEKEDKKTTKSASTKGEKTAKKPAEKSSAKKSKTKTSGKKEATKKASAKQNNNVDLNFDDFNKELNTALTEVNDNAKKSKK